MTELIEKYQLSSVIRKTHRSLRLYKLSVYANDRQFAEYYHSSTAALKDLRNAIYMAYIQGREHPNIVTDAELLDPSEIVDNA